MHESFVQMLREEIAKSDLFARTNFGQMCGPQFPDIVRAVLADEKLSVRIFTDYLASMISGPPRMEPCDDPQKSLKVAAGYMAVWKQPMEFFYWGIQIGKRLAEIEDLQKMVGE